jgi:hypothetical protein
MICNSGSKASVGSVTLLFAVLVPHIFPKLVSKNWEENAGSVILLRKIYSTLCLAKI